MDLACVSALWFIYIYIQDVDVLWHLKISILYTDICLHVYTYMYVCLYIDTYEYVSMYLCECLTLFWHVDTKCISNLRSDGPSARYAQVWGTVQHTE